MWTGSGLARGKRRLWCEAEGTQGMWWGSMRARCSYSKGLSGCCRARPGKKGNRTFVVSGTFEHVVPFQDAAGARMGCDVCRGLLEEGVRADVDVVRLSSALWGNRVRQGRAQSPWFDADDSDARSACRRASPGRESRVGAARGCCSDGFPSSGVRVSWQGSTFRMALYSFCSRRTASFGMNLSLSGIADWPNPQ